VGTATESVAWTPLVVFVACSTGIYVFGHLFHIDLAVFERLKQPNNFVVHLWSWVSADLHYFCLVLESD
jgi:hypothetical protein